MHYLLLLVFLLVPQAVFTAEESTPPLASGYGSLGYPLPVAGSYDLPPFMDAADGEVLDSDGNRVQLHQLLGDRYSLLSFMYSSCSDINGCPLSAFVFYQLKNAMGKDPELAKNLRLVSLSFDPQRDSPDVMKLYANNFKYAKDGGEWLFATTASEEKLQPILKSYAQDTQREMSVDGKISEDISHVLRVFLIDPQKQVRNIYSVSFLHKDIIQADLETLMLEEQQKPKNVQLASLQTRTFGPGDVKDGYEQSDYVTRSQALQNRRGTKANLRALIDTPPLGLPPVPQSLRDIATPSRIELGRKLFFDRRLSLNDTFSCAMCHIPEQGFSSNELSTAVGIEGRSVRRNTPTVLNIAYAEKLFHDGREDSLAQQVWGPLLAKNEMGNPSVGFVINKIKSLPDYQGYFEKAFDGQPVNMQTLGDALAAYQSSLNAADSPFDRWKYAKKMDAITESSERGYQLFTGKAGCSSCHTIGENSAVFSDNQLHNTGVGYLLSQPDGNKKQKVQLAPGVFVEVDQSVINKVGNPLPADLGLYEITENPADRWFFKTPTLRNISLTAPYMHDGSLQTLQDVVDFYNNGGIENPLLDPRIKSLQLSESDKQDLVAFLESLTGSNVDQLVADAHAAPVGDIQRDDPRWAKNSGEK